jgi:hypothetical protein
MKKTIYITLLLAVTSVFSSCDKNMEEINTDPLALSHISDEYIFTTAVRATFGDCADILRFASQYSHIYVTNNEMRAADSYLDFHTQDIYRYMFEKAYINQLRNINEVLIMTGSGETKNDTRNAIANIVAVIDFSQISDQWGDIPYFEGAQGSNGILFPKYDSQKEIYHDMIDRLTSAISILKSADPAKAYPGADPIYNNDLSKWIAFANSLRLRLAMKIRFADAAYSAPVITDCMSEPFIETNDQNYELKHEVSDNPDLYNHWYDLRKSINWKMSQKFTDWLLSTSDPRLDIIVEKNSQGVYKGVPNGLNDQAVSQIDWTTYSNPQPALYAKDLPEFIMCASEVWFLRAEAALFNLAPGDPNALYQKGITADMSRWNIPLADITAFLSGSAGTLKGTDENKFSQIGTQMWISFVPNFNEAWTYIKRTGYPVIPQRTNESVYSLGVTNGYLPKRFKYASTEYLNNNKNVTEAVNIQGSDKIDTPVWWDARGN